tara:strand:- start:1434 stop:1928 length:495 start_codon:yes stop_codon:yes gene_type:complete
MLYLPDEIIYIFFENINNIHCFSKLMILNSQYYKISKYFNKKQQIMLLKYYICNNTYNNYLKFNNYLELYDINLNLILEYCINNYKNNLININNLTYYDLNYIFELIIKGANINKKMNKNILIFYNRIIEYIKYSKDNKVNRIRTIVHIKHDDLLMYSLNKLKI